MVEKGQNKWESKTETKQQVWGKKSNKLEKNAVWVFMLVYAGVETGSKATETSNPRKPHSFADSLQTPTCCMILIISVSSCISLLIWYMDVLSTELRQVQETCEDIWRWKGGISLLLWGWIKEDLKVFYTWTFVLSDCCRVAASQTARL